VQPIVLAIRSNPVFVRLVRAERASSIPGVRSLLMRITVNGKPRDLADGSSVADLVASLGFGKKQVVVERNGEPLERSRFASVTLAPDDVVEVVRPVQGGAP